MSESQNLLLDSAESLFAELSDEPSLAIAWGKFSELGFELLLVEEAAGGFGGDWGDAFAVLRSAGGHALALPVGEAVVAARLAADAGFTCGNGHGTLGPAVVGALDAKDRFTGQLPAVPWGGEAQFVLFDLDGAIVCVATADARIERRVNPAGEARDTLTFEGVPAQRGLSRVTIVSAGAFVRTAQIAGALDTALAMSIQYANERSQFGKPIGKFQAVQQALAMFAEEAAAVNCAGQAAARALDRDNAAFEIAAAKLRANMAAAVGASTAHQVHGAIGFTQAHGLHHLTRRLVSWRSEFGGERWWADFIGRDVAARGADALWPFLTARDEPPAKGLT